MRVVPMLAVGYVLLAWSPGDAVRFIHPKRFLILSGPRGVSFPVQAFIPRHVDNRAYRIQWDGETCGGAAAATLDGDADRALHPLEPIQVYAGQGVCSLAVFVFTGAGRVRAQIRRDVTVCGEGC